jgi:peptidyl-prolyl cis-trans isomerase C
VIKKLLAAFLLLGPAAMVSAQSFGPVATVNGVEISRSKMQAQVSHRINQLGMGSGGITQPGTYKNIQEEVLEQLIVQELLWQEAQRREFVVSGEDVEQQLQKMKSGFDSEMAFHFKIKEGGFTEATYKEDIRQQRSAQRMLYEGIVPDIAISDEDVKKFYDENIDRMSSPEQVRARHILVVPKSDDDEGERLAREKLAAAQKALADGTSFALVAIENSEGSSATGGGDLGFFGRGQMVPAFEAAVFALQPGEISDVVETKFGYHIIKLEERREAQTVSVGQAADRITDYLRQQRIQGEVEILLTELREEGEVEIFLN